MDFTSQNLEAIRSLHLSNMTVEQMVQAERRVESRSHLANGTWWLQVKPFFYRPASLMDRIAPHRRTPKPWLALGGYYHMVPEGAPSNGAIVVNEIPNLVNYQLDSLPKKVRHDIRKGLGALRIRQVSNLTDLLVEGYQIYLAWERRMGNVRVKRSKYGTFCRWITRVFHHPYNLVLGAYCENRLVSYVFAQAVDGIADLSKSFTDPDFYRLSPSSALIYSYITICSRNPEIRKACNGLRSTKDSLEHFKAHLGFQQVSYPAFIHLRMGLRPLVRRWMPEQYRRLMGQYRTESPRTPQHQLQE
jgi:hypothetical protein